MPSVVLARKWIMACQMGVLFSLSTSPTAQVQVVPAPPAVKPRVHVEEVVEVRALKPVALPAKPVSPPTPLQEDAGEFGTGVLPPGPGMTNPVPIEKHSPPYTFAAMMNRVQGSIDLQAVIRADGTVGDVRIIKSLDRRFGMDEAAITAAKAWRFVPARDANGVPTPVLVVIGFDLRLNDKPTPAMKVTGPRGGQIVPPRRASGDRPAYPEAARQKRVQGTVVVEAYTNLNGEVVYARVRRSVPALDQSALDAVRAWRYTRTLLDLEPTETRVTATINFVLH